VTPRKRRWIIFSVATAGLLTAGLVAVGTRIPLSANILRSRVVDNLSERLNARVELGDITLRIVPGLHAEVKNLAIRFHGRRDVPPLISVATVTIDADLLGLWRRHVAHVNLEGLAVNIPPGGMSQNGSKSGNEGPQVRGVETAGAPSARDDEDEDDLAREVVIDELVADDSTLTILRSDPAKKPRVWSMHRLRLSSVGAQTAMPFESLLTNAIPPGAIDTTGSFGPWNRDDPGQTPIGGAFTFEDADLSVFKGISGILSAKGTYDGTLERIDVNGETSTPQFMVNVSGHAVPLTTKYRATVDATNGNTTLNEIDATFLRTSLIAKGGVYDVEGVKGRLVTLDIDMKSGRLEDVMTLAVKGSKPPMTGALALSTKFELPPGDRDVVDKLKLNGAFNIDNGRFTNPEVQRQINELSHRAQGRKLDAPRSAVGSDFSGRFKLGDGRLTLDKLTFDVPGAVVELTGVYGLEAETLNFSGNLYMNAKVSQTVSGWKSLLLKIVDPLFRKKGRTVVPIKISGPRGKPQFGIDPKRVF
jgi:hypothetical protein